MHKAIKLSAILASILTLNACSTFEHMDDPASPYQQCKGLKQQMIFTRTNLGSNNLSQFQINQQLGMMVERYNKMNCDQVLQEKGSKDGK